MNRLKYFIAVIFFPLFLWNAAGCEGKPREAADAKADRVYLAASDDERIAQAFQNKLTGILVQSSGKVEKILPDDQETPRHQKFIIRLSSGQTLLINHNIDLAPRLNDLKPGDTIIFRGEYLWNRYGGAVHWTHHDPQKKHPEGWIEWNGRRYE